MNKTEIVKPGRVLPAWKVGGHKIVVAGLPCCEPMGDGSVMSSSGIYLCYNRVSGVPYIGVTSQPFKARRTSHLGSGERAVNARFRADLKKYGRGAFDYYPIEIHYFGGVPREERVLLMQSREKYWIGAGETAFLPLNQ